MIQQDSIAHLKQIVDIVDVVSDYIELKRAGANYAACCPFHNEKTPSFIISPQKNYYTCFGCGKGGDSITFVMEFEHLSFQEAVEKLADKYNITLEYTRKKEDSGIYEYLSMIARFYQSKLNHNANISHYLNERGISNQSIERFGLGYSGGNEEFFAFLREKNIPLKPLEEIGIVGKNNMGHYVKFNNRIMFPIHAQNGKIVGFGGRDISGRFAKYINSQQSKIFNKSKLLYGYNLARGHIFREKSIIITEGYIDTIMMSQAGFDNVVATLGTTLTKDHLPLLSKGEVDVLLCYDGDQAGINAAYKASLLLANKNGGVVIFDDNKDPADILQEGNAEQLMQKLRTKTPFIEFIIEQITSKHNLNNPLHKEKALQEILAFTRTLSPLLQDEYKQFIANRLAISPHIISPQNMQTDTKAKETAKKLQSTTQIVEAILIKSILENEPLLDFALEYINADSFMQYRQAFELLLNGDREHESLIRILLDSSIATLKFEDFKEQLRLFIINHYTKQLNTLKRDTKSDVTSKIAKAKEINKKLQLLKQGTLVKLDM